MDLLHAVIVLLQHMKCQVMFLTLSTAVIQSHTGIIVGTVGLQDLHLEEVCIPQPWEY